MKNTVLTLLSAVCAVSYGAEPAPAARMDRSKLLIGAYCLQGNAKTDAHVKADPRHAPCAVELLRAVAAERVVPEPMSAEFGRRHSLRAASSVRFALDTLLNDELLYKRDDGYVVYDRLFAEWLRA